MSEQDKYTFPTIFPVTCHTDHVGIGSTYFALPGERAHGIAYIDVALAKGAHKIVVPDDVELAKQIVQKIEQAGVRCQRVKNIRQEFARQTALAHDNPAGKLSVIGVTGTKGKTTTSFIIKHILQAAGFKTALIGTVHNEIDAHILPHTLTTPHADYLHMFFAQCIKQGVTHVIMEVSAQALTLDRVHGIQFAGVIFTNFSQEHAEFYATQQDYFNAKCQIFNQLRLQAPVVLNTDDAWYAKTKQAYTGLHVVTVGIDQPADYPITVQHSSMQKGLQLTVGTHITVCPKLVGIFNAYNCGMAVALCAKLGVGQEDISKALLYFSGVKGRMQTYQLPNGAQCIIDHAHTPSSFEAVLSTLRMHTHHLIAVFGIGGNRDSIKRPLLGVIAARYADIIILTSDNPRYEDPIDIINDIKRGIPKDCLSKVYVVLDREQAIKKGYALSDNGTILAVLAKGSDEYQEVKGVKYPFYEKDIVQKL